MSSGVCCGVMASKQRVEEAQEAEFPWGELPLEVQYRVLGWLPLRPLFRSKRVCKLWNTTISAQSFTHFPSILASRSNPRWLIFFTPKSFDFLLAFDFDQRSWFKFDVGFVSSMLNSMHSLPLTSPSTPWAQRGFVWCTGSASGLLLLDFRSSLHVCNPFTKSLVRLPPFKSIQVPVTQGFSTTHIRSLSLNVETFGCTSLCAQNDGQGFSTAPRIRDNVDDSNCSMRARLHTQDYTVVVIGKATTDLVIEEYCASRNSWDIVGSMPTSFIIRHDQMMECNGLFYSLLLNPLGMLVVGENDENAGSNWRIQSMPDHYGSESRRLLACQNAIFMVCPIDEKNNGFVIWRFQPVARSWIKMSDMPDHILEDVESISCSNWVDCVGVGDFICFRALCSLRVLTYDLCNEKWSWLPVATHIYDMFLARGLQFEPRLDYRQSLLHGA